MEGYSDSSYGDAFADVYDDWYPDVTDVGATVARIVALAGPGGTVLELGVGTGRLALPMAAAGLTVTGVDSSPAMIERLLAASATRSDGASVAAVIGDMVDDIPPGPFDVVLVAYNTIFNLRSDDRQRACFAAVGSCLRPGGHLLVEAIVPNARATGHTVSVRSMTADRVVLSVCDDDPAEQRSEGQFVELTESAGVRLRPWSIRWATPEQLDTMAAAAGLVLVERFASMDGTPFDEHSGQRVAVYRRPS